MPKLTAEQKHDLALPEVRARLEALNTRLASKYGIKASWVSDTEAKLERTGLSGTVTLQRANIIISLQISLVLWPFKSAIDTGIRRELAAIARK